MSVAIRKMSMIPEVAHKPWWCRHCNAFVDALDPGEVFPQCEKCRKRGVLRWHGSEMNTGPIALAKALPQLPEPPEPRKAQKQHRLPPEKRNLRVLARSGYWFCYGGCQQITEGSEQECCVLCGAALHQERDWVAPPFPDDVTGPAPELGNDGRYPDDRKPTC